MVYEKQLDMQNEAIPHDARLDALNGPSFTLTVVVTPTDAAYPRSKAGPLYFTQTPTSDAHVGFSVGSFNGDGVYVLRMGDGAKHTSGSFSFPQQPLGAKYEYALSCRKEATGRFCSLEVNGAPTADGEIFLAVNGTIYDGSGGVFGNAWGWRFTGTVHQLALTVDAANLRASDSVVVLHKGSCTEPLTAASRPSRTAPVAGWLALRAFDTLRTDGVEVAGRFGAGSTSVGKTCSASCNREQDVAFLHDGHCGGASQWISPNQDGQTLASCAALCGSHPTCAFIAFNSIAEKCARYRGDCEDDDQQPDYNAYRYAPPTVDTDGWAVANGYLSERGRASQLNSLLVAAFASDEATCRTKCSADPRCAAALLKAGNCHLLRMRFDAGFRIPRRDPAAPVAFEVELGAEAEFKLPVATSKSVSGQLICSSVEVVVGSSCCVTRTVSAPAAPASEELFCPSEVSVANWLGTETVADTFAVTTTGADVTVTRKDTAAGWSMNLRFLCSKCDKNCWMQDLAVNKNAAQSIAGPASTQPKYNSRDECVEACCARSDCYAFAYFKPAFGGAEARACYFMTKALLETNSRVDPSTWPSLANVESGRIERGYQAYETHSRGRSCGGGFLLASNLGSEFACRDACTTTAACKFYTFYASNNYCQTSADCSSETAASDSSARTMAKATPSPTYLPSGTSVEFRVYSDVSALCSAAGDTLLYRGVVCDEEGRVEWKLVANPETEQVHANCDGCVGRSDGICLGIMNTATGVAGVPWWGRENFDAAGQAQYFGSCGAAPSVLPSMPIVFDALSVTQIDCSASADQPNNEFTDCGEFPAPATAVGLGTTVGTHNETTPNAWPALPICFGHSTGHTYFDFAFASFGSVRNN
jgi:hypothetical protein